MATFLDKLKRVGSLFSKTGNERNARRKRWLPFTFSKIGKLIETFLLLPLTPNNIIIIINNNNNYYYYYY